LIESLPGCERQACMAGGGADRRSFRVACLVVRGVAQLARVRARGRRGREGDEGVALRKWPRWKARSSGGVSGDALDGLATCAVDRPVELCESSRRRFWMRASSVELMQRVWRAFEFGDVGEALLQGDARGPGRRGISSVGARHSQRWRTPGRRSFCSRIKYGVELRHRGISFGAGTDAVR